MPKGYTGNILRVNLSNNSVSVDNPDDGFYRKYAGGAGLIAYFLLKEIKPGIDPMGPDNKLIFAPGPLTGTPLPGGARNSVGAKSPRSGGYAKAEAGAFFGAELKRAGFDAIIVEGKAAKPVYLWVHDGEAEIRDASRLWGMNTKESQTAIREELGDTLIRTAQIGPGGENLVSYAAIINDLFAAAARTGLGSIMGSKNLKAVAVRGHKAPEMADPAKVRDLTNTLREYLATPAGSQQGIYGTGRELVGGATSGNLPIHNFRDGEFPGADKLGSQYLKEIGLMVDMESCYACPVHCKKVIEYKGADLTIDRAYGGPEYETLGAFGSTCGVGDPKAVCKAHELCNAFSLDTISTGVTIAFAMECYENGLLTSEDTGGIDLRFGNAAAMLKVIELIARREGIGDLLAEGSRKASQRIGKGAEKFAMQVKGVEVPMHEPRLKQALGLNYSVNSYGADHMVGIHDTSLVSTVNQWGFTEPFALNDLGPRKVAIYKYNHLWRHFLDSIVLCMFVRFSEHQAIEAVRAITGWNATVVDALKIGERAVTLARAFNMREGLTSADDRLPDRFFQPTTSGALKNTAIDPEAMEKAIHTYYGMMGWDKQTGVPTADKLEELEMNWAVDAMAAGGVKSP